MLMRNLARKTVCTAAMIAGLHGCASTNAPTPAIDGVREKLDAYLKLPAECKVERISASCKVNSDKPIRIYDMDAEVSIAGGRPKLDLKDAKDHTVIWNSSMGTPAFIHGDWSYEAKMLRSAVYQSNNLESVNGETVKDESSNSASVSFSIAKIAPAIDCNGKKMPMEREREEQFYPDTRRILGKDTHMSISISPNGDSVEIRFYERKCEERKGNEVCKEAKKPQKHQVKEGETARFSSKETDKAVLVEQIFFEKSEKNPPHATLVIFKRPEDCKGI